MRKVIYGGACSLDGYFADRDGAIDWLHFSKDVENIMAASWATTDTILFGRKTWEFAAGQGGGGSMKGMSAYVFSKTLTKLAGKGAELVTTDAGEFVQRLKMQAGKDIRDERRQLRNLAAEGRRRRRDRPERSPRPARQRTARLPGPGRACQPRADGVPPARRRVSVRSLRGQAVTGIATGRTLIR